MEGVNISTATIKVNDNKLFEGEVDGIKLDVSSLMLLHRYYEACCTAEYIMENNDIKDEHTAINLGYRARDIMDKYGIEEEFAIDRVMAEYEEEQAKEKEERDTGMTLFSVKTVKIEKINKNKGEGR